MKHTVVWTRAALDQLATLWMDATDRNAVAQASDEIDRRLSNDPQNEGEQREGLVRILIIDPLAATFVVRAGDRLATVFWIHRTRA